MARKINDRGLEIIKKYEGYSPKAYKCPAGVWTIGYGHTFGVAAGLTCIPEQATAWLKVDISKAELAVEKYDKIYHFTDNEFSALVSFTYNCGAGNLSTLLDKGRRNRDQIRAKLPLYVKANGKRLNGLVNRRDAELKLFNTK